MSGPTRAALGAVLLSLALPAVASAATKAVSAGPPLKKPPAGVPRDSDDNAFFPSSVKIHAGDRLRFTIAGFHAINFVKKHGPAPGLAQPFDGPPVSGATDQAGAPFWFNGQPQVALNPSIVTGTKSPTTYDGSQDIGSGAPLQGAPKPWVVRFPKTGRFTFYCPIHPGMKGTVAVVPKGRPVPSAAADAARAKRQLAKALRDVKRLDRRKPPRGDVVEAGPDHRDATLYRFTPAKKTVTAGTTLTLTMSRGTYETHTFTFADDAKSLQTLAKGFIGPLPGTGTSGPPTIGFDPVALYPSDPQLTEDGKVHGNGFVNTGALDSDRASPMPLSAKVTFSTPGTYHYICLIHPEMKGEVVVTP